LIKRSHIEIIDFNDDEFKEKEEATYYCKHCEEFGFKVQLLNRVYAKGEPIPIDHDQFKQCHTCGTIYPVYELQKESEIKDVMETTSSPFDVAKDQFLGVGRRTSVNGIKARKKRERQQELDSINDDDVKRELAKGHALLSYSEQMP